MKRKQVPCLQTNIFSLYELSTLCTRIYFIWLSTINPQQRPLNKIKYNKKKTKTVHTYRAEKKRKTFWITVVCVFFFFFFFSMLHTWRSYFGHDTSVCTVQIWKPFVSHIIIEKFGRSLWRYDQAIAPVHAYIRIESCIRFLSHLAWITFCHWNGKWSSCSVRT